MKIRFLYFLIPLIGMAAFGGPRFFRPVVVESGRVVSKSVFGGLRSEKEWRDGDLDVVAQVDEEIIVD